MFNFSFLANISLVIITAMFFWFLFEKIKLPGLLGMIFTGILLGPYGVNFISPQIFEISKELKTAALIIILIRAGLGINKEILNKVGLSAIKMSCIPGIIEGFTIALAAKYILGFSFVQGGLLGFIIAAVSPAVVVPQMLDLKEKGFGKKKEIPTLILAGASADDVFAITIFTAFLSIAAGKTTNYFMMFLSPFISIFLGIALGLFLGISFVLFFKKFHIRDSKKIIIFMIIAIFFHESEKFLPIASLIGIMAMGFVILEKYDILAHRLAAKFNRIWVLAEILLFVLIGSQVNTKVILNSGFLGLSIIIIGLFARSLGVFTALYGSNLNLKEKIFCVISYWPKATVQAAIGAIPLEQGIQNGDIILAVAVLSIIITAPLGAVGIKLSHEKLLEK